MRFVSTTIAAAAFAVLSSGMALAATPADDLAPVLDACPTNVTIGCAGAVRDFIGTQEPGRDLDQALKTLAAELAYRARNPIVTQVACIELKNGIREAGKAMSLPSPRQQLQELAAGLCTTDRDHDGGYIEVEL